MANIVEDDTYLLYTDSTSEGVSKFFIASPFDANKVYKEGDMVWYDGILYQSNHTFTVASDFDEDYWDSITVGDAISMLYQAKRLKIVSNDEYIYAVTDNEDRFLFGIKSNGDVDWSNGIPDIIKTQLDTKALAIDGRKVINSTFADGVDVFSQDGYLHTLTDKDERVIAAVEENGDIDFETAVNFNGGVKWSSDNLTDLQKALAENGVDLNGGNIVDWSNSTEVHIQVPKLARVNFIMNTALPSYKGDKKNGELEFWDMQGNYFKKKIEIDVQGNSTQYFPKKNYAVDLLNEDDSEFTLQFGSWVPQDSYHFKAWWVDLFRGLGQVYYNFLTEIWKYNRGPLWAPWMKALIPTEQLNNRGYGASYGYQPAALDCRLYSGATCHPEGFPMILYYNGTFVGIYSFAIKKHRKNYHMDKSDYLQILIDGVLHKNEFWAGHENIDWTSFELKNPKKLITMDGSEYDGDNPQELIDSSSAAWNNSKNQKNTKKTKEAIEALSDVMPQIEAAVTQYGVNSQEVEDLYNHYFDVDNLIDYIIFSDVLMDTDTGANNVLWTTWDGVKWYACPYDIDRILGMWQGYCMGNDPDMLLARTGFPTYYIGQNTNFRTRLANRYKELRDAGIISVDSMFKYAVDWSTTIGENNYELEYKKWPQNVVNNDSTVNTEYWEIDATDMSNTGTWNKETEYQPGDVVYYGAGNVAGSANHMGFYKFTCVKTNTNERPFSSLAYKDSLWRLYSWITIQIRMMDNFYNY